MSDQYQRYPASSSAPPRQVPYQVPGAYPHSPSSSSSSYVPPPPPPPPTPPVNLSQSSQYLPPSPESMHSLPHNHQGKGPKVFCRLDGRRNTLNLLNSQHNPSPIQTATSMSGAPSAYPQQPRSADTYNSQYHHLRNHYQQPNRLQSFSSTSSVSSSSSSGSSNSACSSRQQQAIPDISRLRFEESHRQSGRKRATTPNRVEIPRRPPGYKSPSVESVPPSPASFATLSPDSKHVLDEDEGYFSTLSAVVKARLRNEPMLEDCKPKPAPEPSPASERIKPINKTTEFRPTLVKSDSWKRYPLQYFENSESGLEPDSPGGAPPTRKPRPYPMNNDPPSALPAPRQPRPYSIKPDTPEPAAAAEPRAPRPYALKTDPPKMDPPSPIVREPRPYTHSPSPQIRYQPPPPESQVPPRSSPQLRYRQTPPPPSPAQQVALRPPPKRDPAPPLEQLPPCPKKTLVRWNKWYQIPSIPDFDICISCYYTHVYPSPFFAHFVSSDKPYGVETSCYFNTDRVLQKFWPQVLHAGNFNVLREYASMRSKVPPCTGVEGASVGGLSAKRWKVYDGSISKFRCCDACYNDIVLATGFAANFAPAHPQPEDKVWTCDLAVPFIAGGMLQLSKYQDATGQDQWDEFRKIALYRLNDVPACPGTTPVKGSGRKWWKPINPIPGLTVCDACYCDDIVPHFKEEFVQAVIPAAQSSQLFSCAMSKFSIKGPWALAVERNSYQVWWDAARAAFDLPLCTEKGFSDHAVGGEWFTLQHHDQNLDNFKCCQTCYYTLLRPLNLAHHFEPVLYVNQADPASYNSSVVRVCSLTPDSQRFLPLLEKLGEAANWKKFGIFLSYIIPRARIPPCQPGKFLARAKWYGTDDFVVCEECWFEYVRESSLAHCMTVHARFSPEPQACDLYSLRMKKIWEEACQMRDLHHFVHAAVERGNIYCKILERSKEINDLIAARKNSRIAPRYSGIVVRVGEDGQPYGNVARHDSGGVGDPVTADLYKRLDSLQKEWKSVE